MGGKLQLAEFTKNNIVIFSSIIVPPQTIHAVFICCSSKTGRDREGVWLDTLHRSRDKEFPTMATMTRQHFAVIADVLKERLETAQNADTEYPEAITAESVLEGVIEQFAIVLRGTNPNFNESKFLQACGRG